FQVSLRSAHKSLSVMVLSLHMPQATLGTVWSTGSIEGGDLHDLLARFRQGGADLRAAIEAQSGQGLCLCTPPASDHDRQGGEPGPQLFTEIARLGKASRRHQHNT